MIREAFEAKMHEMYLNMHPSVLERDSGGEYKGSFARGAYQWWCYGADYMASQIGAGERQHNRMTRDDWIGAIAFIAMMLAICIV